MSAAINHRTQDRVHWAYECDHMRHVVRHEDGWRHVDLGVLGSTCTAGIYRVDVRYSGDHSASQAVVGAHSGSSTSGGEQ